jgi:hypothetical protein
MTDDSGSEAPPHEIVEELRALGVRGVHLRGYDCADAMRCRTGRPVQSRRCGRRVLQDTAT